MIPRQEWPTLTLWCSGHMSIWSRAPSSLCRPSIGRRVSLSLSCLLGLLEGFKVEKADLQEALGKKEESERQLILELETLRKQLQQAARELLALKDENAVLWKQKETCTNDAREREAGETGGGQEAERDGGTQLLVLDCMKTFPETNAESTSHCLGWLMVSAGHREDTWGGGSIQLLCSGPEGVCLQGRLC